jgi:hypothetical protein
VTLLEDGSASHYYCVEVPVNNMSSPQLLKAMQERAARIAIGSSSMRGRGGKGVVKAGRAYLGDLSLADFGTSDPKRFRRQNP